jgi:hypothetical protein
MVKLLDEDHMQGLELNMVQEKEVEHLQSKVEELVDNKQMVLDKDYKH